jgi:DMSO/TMAO reductase YedYZ heme-binding membrane subunit
MNGARLVATATLGLLAIFGIAVSTCGTDEEGLRALTRITARVSFLLFLAPYSASSVRRLFPSPATRWMLRNRRALGLSFFVAHMLHGLAIWMLALLLGDAFEAHPITVLAGGMAYLLLVAMALTSTDRTAAWLGARRWNALHRIGMHWLWFIFAYDWVVLSLSSPGYLPLAALSFGALGLRIAARRARTGNGVAVAPTAA